MWHPVIVTLDGPSVDESENTFRNYRLNVTFTKGMKSFVVHGFFAADGNAGETSATSGNKWRAICKSGIAPNLVRCKSSYSPR